MRRLTLTVLAIILVACTLPSAAPVSPLAQPRSPLLIRSLYFPVIRTPPSCLRPGTERLYSLLTTDSRQQRTLMRCNPALMAAAQARAMGLTKSDLVSHCDAQGVCANRYARAAGCRLPAAYGEENNVESLAAGSWSADAIFNALALSSRHAEHMFGRNDFFRAQTDVGIAVATGGKYGWWWVIMIGICE